DLHKLPLSGTQNAFGAFFQDLARTLLVTLAVINRILTCLSFVWIQSAKPTLLTILCALANLLLGSLTDWILSSYDFRLRFSLLIEYLDVTNVLKKQNKELRQLYQRWTNRNTICFPVDELGKERSQGNISIVFIARSKKLLFQDLHWANLNLFTSLLFETTPPNSFDNTGLTDLGWKFAGTLWACKDKVDISSIGIERTWFMEITFLQLDLFKNGMQVTYRRLKVERIGGGHFHFNVAVGKYSFTKLEYDRVLFLALVNAQYLFNEEMNNRKSTILQIENVWCQRI
ncbi:hypothetical protein ACJX0J_000585, partial (mitochondrion) [Zea mays]